MEIIIEGLTRQGVQKVVKVFDKQVAGFYIDRLSDTVTLILKNDDWIIHPSVDTTSIYKDGIIRKSYVTLKNSEFTRIYIQ